jgi:methylphosphotriester-DNA--protein-cysteine methyltransferase
MISHLELGDTDFKKLRQLKRLIDDGNVRFAGNIKLRIYGTVSCSSGKRMKIENRVFFKSSEEAIKDGYRPCGHCMHREYLHWKKPTN